MTTIVKHTNKFGKTFRIREYVGHLDKFPVPDNCFGPQWNILRQLILYRDFGLCQYCGDLATDVDHIVPRSQGGSNGPDNLIASCKSCNSRKGPHTPEQANMKIRITMRALGELNEY